VIDPVYGIFSLEINPKPENHGIFAFKPPFLREFNKQSKSIRKVYREAPQHGDSIQISPLSLEILSKYFRNTYKVPKFIVNQI
jgi:hypothetical protein